MEKILLLVTGFVLGMRHAFDPDHISAVTHFISIQPQARKGVSLGIKWGIGHFLTVLLIGSVIILFKIKMFQGFEKIAEILVGVTLILLAIWRLSLKKKKKRHLHLHQHEDKIHTHSHWHIFRADHMHTHAPTVLGMLHGAAGSLAVFVLIPLSFVTSTVLAYSYILVFGLGCIISMSVYGFLAGYFYQKSTSRGLEKIFTILVLSTAFSGLGLGAFWIIRNI